MISYKKSVHSTREYVPATRGGGEGLSVSERAKNVAANGDTSIQYNPLTYEQDLLQWAGVSGKPTRQPIRIQKQTINDKSY